MPRELKGIIIPAVTPFMESGEIDFAAMEHNYRKWSKTDVEGFMCLGSNGEFRSLTDDESFAVIKKAAELKGDRMLIAGIGRESLYHTLAFLDRLHEAKPAVDFVSVLTPCYFAGLMSDEALVDYFTRVADHSRYPVLLYCAPTFVNNVCISVDAVRTLADHPNIYGIKDTSKVMMDDYMDAVGGREDFSVLAGSVGNLAKCLAKGGKGGVVSAANYFPSHCVDILKAFEKDGLQGAETHIAEVQRLAKATGAKASVSTVKATMNLVGLKGGYTRRPILPVKESVVEEIRTALKAENLSDLFA
ncbi:dihydrodipicolinate synthase family protein [Selenomonas sp. TAMA-11512]|uniref:dihydrodipicolinate synthase family protein n=1 Tax=Selenomonas sp. TAMA-11512 TaxID=3095337 RepID=UPI0030905D5C|nr:dihydrodipicolinate synthase family protein [Selenomonas sp. TAMA-11512]